MFIPVWHYNYEGESMKKILVVILACLFVMGTVSLAEVKYPTGLKVGHTVIDLSNLFFVNLSNAIKAKCEELGYEYILNDGKSDPAVQIAAIENFIVNEVDVIIVTPIDGKTLGNVLQEARDAGILIIASDQDVPVRDAHIALSEYEYGYTAGKIAADWINANMTEQATVGILNRPISETLIQRSDGFKDGVTQNSNAVIVAEQTANTAELGLKVTESILQNFPDITGFVCQNDTAGLGCFEALTAAGREAGSTFVVGVDGLQEAFKKIAAGTMYVGSVNNSAENKAKIIFETIVRVMNSGPIEEVIYSPVVPVTIDNVANFLD